MSNRFFVTAAVSALFISGLVMANSSYNDGAGWANQKQSQGTNAISSFNPADTIPGYTSNPSETGHYGGVMSPGVNLEGPGKAGMTGSDAGKAITESILNTPPDNKPSLDAPFIAEGLKIQEQAETITGGGFTGCVDQPASFSEITTHQCLRDVRVDQYCTRTATITGSYRQEDKYETYVLDLTGARQDGSTVKIDFNLPASGTITSAALKATYTSDPNYSIWENTFSALGGAVRTRTGPATHNLGVYSYPAVQGQNEVMNIAIHATGQTATFAKAMATTIRDGKLKITLTLGMWIKTVVWDPRVEWTEYCPFSKNEGTLTAMQCIAPAETRSVIVDGKAYYVYQDCWQWRDTYLTQTETEGTCGEYMRNPACTVTRSECADQVEGVCVSQQVSYSCERKTLGQGKICGGQFFCTDGSCAQAQTGTSNMFGQAVSALAAVAAAGEDVAELNGENVRAFTGEAKSCKKFAVGFSNCCKDSGWGQDVGLSHCSSDEMALGKAKEKKLTIYVGEYCSQKVLGVCIEKKRGYCVFESKLARIVQQQGRRGQLGIGFGSGSSPNCRGVTVEELQQLNFGIMDFSDFYSDLDTNSNLPQDQELLKKAQDIIAEKMQENAP